ncbi:MAG: FixH family protein, partial [Sulfuricellaceae bacterium]|nr:FixH family protein [Sulfuricellaceae bacterium]
IAAAVVLSIVGNRNKNGSEKLHWAPFVMIVFFSGLAVLMAIFMLVATRGLPTFVASKFMPNATGKLVHTGFSVVIEHDENAAKAVSQHLDTLVKQRSLGWLVDIGGLQRVAANQQVVVEITTLDRDHTPLRDASVTVTLQQLAVSSNHYDIAMAETAPGAYRNAISFNHAGHWIVTATVVRGADKYQVMQDVIVSKD